MQEAVDELVKLGRLPSSGNADLATIEKLQALLARIERPISDDDARALVRLFGPDDCFGLAWTLLHLVESAPGWPLEGCLGSVEREWAERLRQRSGE